VKQNEILLKLAETAKRLETKIDKENWWRLQKLAHTTQDM
jgi:hypothetical protein